MKMGRELRFFLALAVCAVFLQFFSYDEQRVALLRLEQTLRTNPSTFATIASACPTLVSQKDNTIEKTFVELVRLPPPQPGIKGCSVEIESESSHRFYLRSHWAFAIQVESPSKLLLLRDVIHVEFPKPLCLLPFGVFFLLIIFEVRTLRYSWLLAGYLLLLGGGNVIQTANLAMTSLKLTATSDQTLLGFALIFLWLALRKSNLNVPPNTRVEANRWERLFNRACTFLIGLWNPVMYTAFGRVLFPFRAEIPKLAPFLNGQVLVSVLSLYLLTFDFKTLGTSLARNLLFPRYFTFTIVTFFLLSYWTHRTRRQVVLWHFPRIWAALLAVGIMEVGAYFIPALNQLGTITRLGLALVASELCWPKGISIVQTAKYFLPWFFALLLALWLPMVSYQSGLTDLAMVLADPRIHPNSAVFFTFLSAVVVGFLTGSFSIAYFVFFEVITKTSSPALLKAALLDGILAGTLLSPFSLFNLMPAITFGVDYRQLLMSRFRQLGLPIAIAAGIYLVSMIQSVTILRPLVFVFLCLIATALQLKRSDWVLSKTRFWLSPDSGR